MANNVPNVPFVAFPPKSKFEFDWYEEAFPLQ